MKIEKCKMSRRSKDVGIPTKASGKNETESIRNGYDPYRTNPSLSNGTVRTLFVPSEFKNELFVVSRDKVADFKKWVDR